MYTQYCTYKWELICLALFYLIIIEIIIELNCNLINCENCLWVIAVCIFNLSVSRLTPCLLVWAISELVSLAYQCPVLRWDSSSEPLGQFQPNLAQSILGCREFKFVQMKGHALLQRGENSEKVKLY